LRFIDNHADDARSTFDGVVEPEELVSALISKADKITARCHETGWASTAEDFQDLLDARGALGPFRRTS
jgi:hypothetical protein